MLLLGNRGETDSEHCDKFLASNLAIDGHSSTDILVPANIYILIAEVGQHCCTSQFVTFGAKFIGLTPSIQSCIVTTVAVNSATSRTIQLTVFSAKLLISIVFGFHSFAPMLFISSR